MAANLALLLTFTFLMVIGTPIAVALGLAGAIGIVVGLDVVSLNMIGPNTYASVAKYPLIAIPLFILTGMIFERAGVAIRLVEFAQSLIGPRKGGLALVAVLVCMIMGGMSGSGPADSAAVMMVMLPSMVKAGYPRGFTAAIVASTGSTAILIPPSVAMIIYSVIVPGMDLRALFAAGMVPGLMVGIAIAIPAVWLSRRHNFGAGENAENIPVWPAFRRALPGLMAPVIILGGLRSGLFTPTETAVVAVFYGLFVGVFMYRTMGFREIYMALVDASKIAGVVMIIISLAALFAWAGSTMGAFRAATDFLLSITSNESLILFFVIVVILVVGMVLDGVSLYLIAIPLLMPIVQNFGWSSVWFGVIMATSVAIGQVTPPVAVNLMVTCKIADIPIEESFRWVAWMVFAMVVVMVLNVLFPELSLWLPRVLGYRVT